jgi:hypothetical protein
MYYDLYRLLFFVQGATEDLGESVEIKREERETASLLRTGTLNGGRGS